MSFCVRGRSKLMRKGKCTHPSTFSRHGPINRDSNECTKPWNLNWFSHSVFSFSLTNSLPWSYLASVRWFVASKRTVFFLFFLKSTSFTTNISPAHNVHSLPFSVWSQFFIGKIFYDITCLVCDKHFQVYTHIFVRNKLNSLPLRWFAPILSCTHSVCSRVAHRCAAQLEFIAWYRFFSLAFSLSLSHSLLKPF